MGPPLDSPRVPRSQSAAPASSAWAGGLHAAPTPAALGGLTDGVQEALNRCLLCDEGDKPQSARHNGDTPAGRLHRSLAVVGRHVHRGIE
jgi:hypothetical protein